MQNRKKIMTILIIIVILIGLIFLFTREPKRVIDTNGTRISLKIENTVLHATLNDTSAQALKQI